MTLGFWFTLTLALTLALLVREILRDDPVFYAEDKTQQDGAGDK